MLAPVVLAGIAAGASVFVATIVAVFFLLQQGGSFDRMRSEAAGLPVHPGEQKPLLYDALLVTARELPTRPKLLANSPGLRGERVVLRDFQGAADVEPLFRISNGEPRYVHLERKRTCVVADSGASILDADAELLQQATASTATSRSTRTR